MYHSDEVRDTVSDADVMTATTTDRDLDYEAWVDDCARAAEAEAQADADLAAMHAAAEADGVDIDFGPFDRAAWEQTMSKYPEGTGCTPVIAPRRDAEGNEVWDAELRRPNKDGTPGYTVSNCLWWPTQKEAWTACVARALTIVTLCEAGRQDMAERFFR